MILDIVSDCHGNIDGLFRALEKKKLVDSSGNRIVGTDHFIVSIGDLANCVGDSISGDKDCLNLVGDVFDTMLIGNHEIPYFDPANKFWGFVWDKEINQKLHSLLDEDLIGAALLSDNTLITHAGISKHFAMENSAEFCFSLVEAHWNDRNFNHSCFSSIGFARGGNSQVGGILWCDFDNEFVPTEFPQICGHTPRGVRMKGNSLCIDVGSKEQDTEPFILSVS
jgi:hypothetical protein